MKYLPLLLLSLTEAFVINMAWTSLPQRGISLQQNTMIQMQFRSTARNHRKMKSQLLLPCRSMAEEEENEIIQNEIDQMKLEALKKLNNLDYRISSPAKESDLAKAASSNNGSEIESAGVSKSTDNAPLDVGVPIRKNPSVSLPRDPVEKSLNLLSGTRWKISFNIGREQGTWMPKDWGVSGDRLIISMEVDFTGEQLYEREDFLGGLGGARILKVKDNQMTLAPSLHEGIRKIRALEGGWRVAKGQGPMGTDILRFYVEIEEQISHKGGDVYCPAGRIYCNCGYFPTNRLSSGRKKIHREKLESMEKIANEIEIEIEEDTAFFSLNKFKKSTELMKLRVDMQKIAEMYTTASVMEPESSILKFSNENDIGLTKEGGVCCKVEKSMGAEYHILGRFSIAPTVSGTS